MARLILVTCALVVLTGCSRGSASPPPSQALVKPLIRDFKVASTNRYGWTSLQTGTAMFSDRNFSYVSVPAELQGQPVLQTSNNDNAEESPEESFISFVTRVPLRVYVIHAGLNVRLTSTWLTERQGWRREPFAFSTTLTPMSIVAARATRYVRSRAYRAGERVQLGYNGCEVDNCDMYTVALVPAR